MKKIKNLFGIFFLFLSLTAPLGVGAKASNDQLTIGTSQEFETLNPIIHQMAATAHILGMTNRVLTIANAQWEYECVLCVDIPTFENGMVKKISEGGREKLLVQWEIKENAEWGDGKPITGEDVKASWQIASSPNVTVGEKEVFTRVEDITVDPQNPRRFTMKFARTDYDYYQMGLFFIVPKHLEGPVFEKTKNEPLAYEKQTTYVIDPTNPGLYSGPYLVKEVKLGSHVILEPNPYFYGEKPKIKRIVHKYIPDTQTLEANLRSGTIDMINEVALKFDQALSLQKRTKDSDPFQVLFRDGVTYEHIDLNLRDDMLKDVRVRQALLYGVDRQKLMQALFEGKQKVALHNTHPQDELYTEDVRRFPYDPDKAKGLLDETGWKATADGYRYKDGKKLSFTLITTAHDKTRELIEVFLQDQWRQIGVGIEIKNEPPRVFFGDTVRLGQYPHMAMFAWVGRPHVPYLATIHPGSIPTKENGYNGQNSGAWVNKEVGELLDKIMVTFDVNERKKLMQRVLALYAEEVPVIPLYYRTEIVVAPKNLENFEITGHQFYSTYNVEKWNLR